MAIKPILTAMGIGFSVFIYMTGGASADEQLRSLVRFEPIDEISTEEFWVLGSATSIGSEGNAVIAYWPFDPDERPEIDGWRRIGIIGAGWFDLGEKPVVAKVFARRDVYFLAEESRAETQELHNSAVAVFGVSPRVCRDEPRDECALRIRFSINDDSVVTGGGVELGVVED